MKLKRKRGVCREVKWVSRCQVISVEHRVRNTAGDPMLEVRNATATDRNR
jgi:hypothetical protein